MYTKNVLNKFNKKLELSQEFHFIFDLKTRIKIIFEILILKNLTKSPVQNRIPTQLFKKI